MNKKEIETKLNNVLKRLGMDIPGWEEVLYLVVPEIIATY